MNEQDMQLLKPLVDKVIALEKSHDALLDLLCNRVNTRTCDKFLKGSPDLEFWFEDPHFRPRGRWPSNHR